MSNNYTVPEFAKKLKVSPGCVYSLISRGEVAKIEGIGRTIRIPSSEIKRIQNKPKCNELKFNSAKIQIVNTSLGDVRKIIDSDIYVLIDIVRVLGVYASHTITRAVDKNYILKLTKEESRDFGIFSSNSGLLLIKKEGLNQYRNVTKNINNLNKLLDELKNEEPKVKYTDTKIGFSEEPCTSHNNLQIFDGHNVEIIEINGQVLFELYSVGVALGYGRGNGKSTGDQGGHPSFPRKDRIDNIVKNAEIKPCVQGAYKYLTESMLYDFMLEAKTDKVKPFRKWVTGTVLPSINNTGGYVANAPKFVDNYFNNFSKELRKEMAVELESQAYSIYSQKEKLEKQYLESMKLLRELQGTLD